MKLSIQRDGFRQDNTEGYNQEQLDHFNTELQTRLDLVADGDMLAYYSIVKSFSDEVARR